MTCGQSQCIIKIYIKKPIYKVYYLCDLFALLSMTPTLSDEVNKLCCQLISSLICYSPELHLWVFLLFWCLWLIFLSLYNYTKYYIIWWRWQDSHSLIFGNISMCLYITWVIEHIKWSLHLIKIIDNNNKIIIIKMVIIIMIIMRDIRVKGHLLMVPNT